MQRDDDGLDGVAHRLQERLDGGVHEGLKSLKQPTGVSIRAAPPGRLGKREDRDEDANINTTNTSVIPPETRTEHLLQLLDTSPTPK